MFCKKCGQQLPDDTKFCTKCGAPTLVAEAQQQPIVQNQPIMSQPYQFPIQPKKKFPAWAIVLIVVGAVLFFFLLIGVLGSITDEDADTIANQSETVISDESTVSKVTSKPNNKTDKKDTYSINEAGTSHGATITVTKVEKSSGSTFDKPKDGMEYVIVHVKIQNTGKEKISYNPYDYKMLNSKGQIVDHGFITVDSDTSLNSGELAPGGVIEGTISFEQPKDDSGLVLEYYDNMFDDNAALKFKLN